jgi:hypothetical protein
VSDGPLPPHSTTTPSHPRTVSSSPHSAGTVSYVFSRTTSNSGRPSAPSLPLNPSSSVFCAFFDAGYSTRVGAPPSLFTGGSSTARTFARALEGAKAMRPPALVRSAPVASPMGTRLWGA